MKKVLVLLALLAAVCGLLTFSAAAESAVVESGACGENLTWTLDAAGTLTVSGTGAMEDYRFPDRAPWYSNCDSIKAVVIESGVTSIGNGAFFDCSSLSSITIPEGVTTIGNSAFLDCSSLSSITIPEGVTTIDGYAFYGCSSLSSITIPESVAAIGGSAFFDCSSLSSITIPESVTTIGDRAFSACRSLTDVYITDLEAWCRINFTDSQAIPTLYAENIYLNGEKIVSCTVPEGITEVKAYTFYGFQDLIQVTIPESVTAIGDSSFYDCSSLTSVTFAENSQLTTISGRAFEDCTSLTSVTFAENSQLTTIGNSAFSGCSSLSSITLPEGVTTVGEYAFLGCRSLTGITISGSVTTIGSGAFWGCTSLSSIEIPEGVTVIQPNVFCGASGIQRVALSKNLKGVLGNAFDGCTNLKEVFYAGSEAEWKALPIAAGNDPLKNATIYYNSTLDDYYCRITVEVSEGGRVAVSANTAKTGDTVTVTATPYRGYALSAIYVDGEKISGDTFTVTGNHRVSAVFTRLPAVGGNEDFRLEGITVLDGAGNPLQELPAERLLVTVTVRHLKESGGGTVMLAQYDERGRYQGLLWLTLEEMPQGMTLKVTLPVDNTGGSIAQLKVFLVESLLSPAPVGEAISFGTI